MRKARQHVFTNDKKEDIPEGWDRAIAEAQRQIAAHEHKAQRLRLSIETFQEMKERGEAFIPEKAA